MSQIPNFPQSLLEEHKIWHHARHYVDITNPPPGYGLEFLRFHRDFIARALAWYAQNGYDLRLVEPWTSVPEQIRQAPCYDRAAEARILYQPESFASADELGRFIEASNLHSCIHKQAARIYGDPDIDDFDVAPHDTVFYNIHGMVDRWWRNWEGLGRFEEDGGYWCGPFEGEGDEILSYSPNEELWMLGKLHRNNVGEHEQEHEVTLVEWVVVGDSWEFGPMDDGRPFRIWDSDGDGKLEVLFRDPIKGYWVEGKVRGGRLRWQPVRLEPSPKPAIKPDAKPAVKSTSKTSKQSLLKT